MSRTVLITGAAGGIGRAIAARFAADGARVVGLDLSDPELPGVTYVHTDVTDAAEVATAVRGAVPAGEAVQTLVTCAGLTEGGPCTGRPPRNGRRYCGPTSPPSTCVCAKSCPG